jgi:Putative DNA-binding domain
MHEIPSSLEEMQHWFASFITSPILESDAEQIPLFSADLISEIRKKIAPSPTLKGEERLGIYQQQYWWRLISVMQELFPTLVALLDYQKFNRLIAEPYLLSHIPQDWFISHIGLDLPEWLEGANIKNEWPLSELARLDIAYEQLIFAEILPFVDASRCENETLCLQPFVLLFEFNRDLFSFREQLLKERTILPLKKSRKKRYFVLYRFNERNLYEEIDPIFFKLLLRFQKGAKLSEVIPLLEKFPDVPSLFQTIASRGWLTYLTVKV